MQSWYLEIVDCWLHSPVQMVCQEEGESGLLMGAISVTPAELGLNLNLRTNHLDLFILHIAHKASVCMCVYAILTSAELSSRVCFDSLDSNWDSAWYRWQNKLLMFSKSV